MGGIAWTEEEDYLLKKCIEQYGEGKWHRVPQLAGLNRCRKSCRLRWLNYLRPNIKRGSFIEEEVDLIIKLHDLFGNRWSLIAERLPGRTANDVKNYWNCHLSKKLNSQRIIEEKQNPSKQDSPRSSRSRLVASTSKKSSFDFVETPNLKAPQEEESSKSRDQNEQIQEMIHNQIQDCYQNSSPIIEVMKNNMDLSNLQMDFQFDQEIEVMEGENGCNGGGLWDDWISEIDLWIDSL